MSNCEGLKDGRKGLEKYSKSRVPWGRVGSIPTAGTIYINPFGISAF